MAVTVLHCNGDNMNCGMTYHVSVGNLCHFLC